MREKLEQRTEFEYQLDGIKIVDKTRGQMAYLLLENTAHIYEV